MGEGDTKAASGRGWSRARCLEPRTLPRSARWSRRAHPSAAKSGRVSTPRSEHEELAGIIRAPDPDINDGLHVLPYACEALHLEVDGGRANPPLLRSRQSGRGAAVGATAIFAATGTTGIRPFG